MGNLQEKIRELRKKVIDYHYNTKTSHVGSSLSCVEILASLYYCIIKPEESFILSKGHASSILYVILNDRGLIPDEKLYGLEEHPTLNRGYGIEATTGSLGHGLSLALGIAIADRKKRSFVLMSDGECDEGQVWEAARLASQLGVNNLIAFIDCNGWQAFKKADYSSLDRKFVAFGWKAVWCDGHDPDEICRALEGASDKPLVILAKTIKGKGIVEMEDKLESHYAKISDPLR
ncbi:transketolase [Candidatus Woesearchaeota archaeon]|nr:transketolase [Candidatus Woesearchaeota archaeon]